MSKFWLGRQDLNLRRFGGVLAASRNPEPKGEGPRIMKMMSKFWSGRQDLNL
jgi:hypothetical protein